MLTKKYYKLIRVSHEDSGYLRLKNVSGEAGIFKMVKHQYASAPNLEYSLDGVNWTTYDFTTLPEVVVVAEANIYFRGTNANHQFNRDPNYYVSISFNKLCEGYGNVCSLFNPDPTVFSAITDIGQAGLAGIFKQCETLIKAPDLSNVTTIGSSGLNNCFNGCTSLTAAPDFSNVTTIGNQGLNNCFNGCTSLTTGPDFSNVTSVANEGLSNCFNGCSKLGDVTAPNISNLTTSVLYNWLANAGSQATGTKVVRVPTGATITTNSTSGIPTWWTRVDY